MFRVLCVVCVSFLAMGGAAFVIAEEGKKPKNTIKEVMGDAHKGGLLKKVTDGSASKADKEKLLGFYVSLYENKPPQGEAASWNAKTSALLAAAAKVVLDDKDGVADLKAASNCKACHEVHKKS